MGRGRRTASRDEIYQRRARNSTATSSAALLPLTRPWKWSRGLISECRFVATARSSRAVGWVAISFLSYIPSDCRNQHPVWHRERDKICVHPETQRPAELNWVGSNLDLFVLWSLPAGPQSVAPYRSPALPNLGIYRHLEIIFQGIIMHQISRMYGQI